MSEWSTEDRSSVLLAVIREILAQPPNDVLQAVKAAAWDEAQAASSRLVNTPLGYHFEYVPAPNPYAALVSEPSTPEQEGTT